MLAVRILKSAVDVLRRKVSQAKPATYQPIDPDLRAGEMVDRLFKLSIDVRVCEVINIEVFREIESIISILGNSGFNFDSENCRLLWSVNQDIHKIERGDVPPQIRDGDLEKTLLVKNRLRLSLIETISIQSVPG